MIKDLNTTITIKGRSGTIYIFNVYGFTKFSELKDAFKSIPALYAFTRRFPNSAISYTHYLLYVGETGDLSTRFNDHHKQECITRSNANCICIKLGTYLPDLTTIINRNVLQGAMQIAYVFIHLKELKPKDYLQKQIF